MKFPKLIPDWFAKMPKQVKLAVITLSAMWTWALIVDPMPVLFITSLLAIVLSAGRLIAYFIEGK